MKVCRFLQGSEIPERQLYKEPPEAFLEADNLEVSDHLTQLQYSVRGIIFFSVIQIFLQMSSIFLKVFGRLKCNRWFT